MKNKFLLALLFILAVPALSLASEPLAALIRISNGAVYDSVVVGENFKATDGYDNLFDTFSAGASLNDTYISAWFDHPEWQQVKSQFRGDIRSIAETQEWTVSVVSTFPAGTPLTVEIDNRLNILPHDLQLTVKNAGAATSASLLAGGKFVFQASAPGATSQLIINAQQQGVATDSLPPATYTVDGDVDGDGITTILDAVAVLRISYGLENISVAAIDHGDMDGDGTLRLADALAVLRKSMGL